MAGGHEVSRDMRTPNAAPNRIAARTIAVAAGILLLLAAAPAPAQIPPTPGVPDTLQGSIHVVKKGDTLWDLAGHYLESPWVWPALYTINDSLIADPHWIFPGQRLLIPVGGGPPVVLSFEEVWPGEETTARAQPRAAQEPPEGVLTPTELLDPEAQAEETRSIDTMVRVTGVGGTLREYYPLVTANAIYAAGFIDEPREWPEGQIIGGENADMNMSMYNQVYLDIGEEEVAAGEYYLVVDQGRKVRHPEWGHYMGRKVIVKGIIRIDQVEGATSQGELVGVFDAVRRKDRVIPAPPVDSRPWKEFVPVQGGRSGMIVALAKDEGNIHPYDMLFIDGGSEEGVRVGDLYRILQPETERGRLRFYEEELGRGVVIAVRETTATVMLLDVTSPDIAVGEYVELVGRGVFASEGAGPGSGR